MDDSSEARQRYVRSSTVVPQRERSPKRRGLCLYVQVQSFSVMSLVADQRISSGRLLGHPSFFGGSDGGDVPGIQLERRYQHVDYGLLYGSKCLLLVRDIFGQP